MFSKLKGEEGHAKVNEEYQQIHTHLHELSRVLKRRGKKEEIYWNIIPDDCQRCQHIPTRERG